MVKHIKEIRKSETSLARVLKSAFGNAPKFGVALGLAAGLGLLFEATLAHSQGLLGQVPSTAEPTRPFERTKPDWWGKPSLDIQLKPEQGSVAPPNADSIRFVLNGIIVEGNTVYKAAAFKKFYADLIRTPITLTEIFTIANKIEAKYRKAGYILTRAVVPVQTVVNSVFKIEVIEGYIDKVTVRGDIGAVRLQVERYLKKLIRTNNNGQPRPTNVRDLERYLLLANDLPGITASGIPQPRTGEGAGKGATELVVAVKRKAYGLFASGNNRGSRFAGPWRGNLQGVSNSHSRLGERASISLFSVLDTANRKEQISGKIDIQANIGSEGITGRIYAGFSPAEPGFTLKELDFRSRVVQAGVAFDYPVVRTHRLTLRIGVGLDYTDSFVDILGQRFNEDRLRVAHLNTSIEFNDLLRGYNRFTLDFRQGLGILGASENGGPLLSRAEGSATFTKITAEFLRRQGLIRNVSLLLAAKYQFTNQVLLAGEEFRVGGLRFGRGYNPSELSGDEGLGASAELRYDKATNWRYLRHIGFYGFYDLGMVWNRDTGPKELQSLTSAGFGVDVTVSNRFSAQLELAQPLTAPLSSRSDGQLPYRAFVRVSTQY